MKKKHEETTLQTIERLRLYRCLGFESMEEFNASDQSDSFGPDDDVINEIEQMELTEAGLYVKEVLQTDA